MTAMTEHQVVSKEQWLEARRAHLAREKELTRLRDELARERRELPWVRVEKEYVFESPRGRVTLADLFGDRSQLLIYHFMFGPEWKEGCPSCSLVVDHLDGAVPHLAARDVSLMMVSRAPLAKIDAFKRRMGWRFPWVSSFGTDFNYDFHVSFAPQHKRDGKVDYNYTTQPFPSDEAPGASVFYKDPSSGQVFHTYSTYGRGLDPFVTTYTLLDLVPKGRDEDQLGFAMAWVRHHDHYEGGGDFLDADKPYWPKVASPSPAPTTSSSCGCGSASAAKGAQS
ncbi:MAG TPA: thioredoxin family protein [Tepidisphaeraceae bacterium]